MTIAFISVRRRTPALAVFCAVAVILLCSVDCSRKGRDSVTSAPSVTHYLYEWREAVGKPWVAYEMSSESERSRVSQWLSLYKTELDFGAELGPRLQLLGRGADLFVEFASDGTSREYTFLYRYPPGRFKEPDHSKWNENLKTDDVAKLRTLFMEYGVQQEMSIQNTCADWYCFRWTSDEGVLEYDISSPRDREAVRNWILAHADIIKRYDQTLGKTTPFSRNLLMEKFAEGPPIIHYFPETPSASVLSKSTSQEREAKGLAPGEIEDLRAIFMKHGGRVDPEYTELWIREALEAKK